MKNVGLILLLLLGFARTGASASIKGKVVDARGNPIPAATLLIREITSRALFTVSTDDQGSFVQVLPAGSYSIASLKPDSDVVLIKLEATEQRQILLELHENGVVAVSSVASMETPETPDADPSLAVIRDYEVQQPQENTPVQQTRTAIETVNPFPAQKGGRFHGSIYEFHRNDNFDARNFFDPLGQPLPEYKRNQFGVSQSVALTKNLNVLGTYEGLRIIQGSTLVSHIPTAAMKQGDFSALPQQLLDPATGQAFEGNRIPESRIQSVSKRLLSLLPDPNNSDPDRNYINGKPSVHNRDTFTFRLDHELQGGSNYFVRYYLSDATDVFAQPLPAFEFSRDGRDQEATIAHNQKITNRLLASVRIGFTRNSSFLASPNSGKEGLLESVGIKGLSVSDPSDEGYPDIQLSGYSSFGDSGPVMFTQNSFNFDGSLSYTPNNHTLKFGGTLNAYQANNNRSDGLCRGRFSFDGYYSGDAFADFLLGLPDAATRGIGSDRQDLRRKAWSLYAHDDWKLGQRFSVSWGLTYNYYQPYHSIRDNISGFYPLVFSPPLDGEMVIAGSERALELGLGPAGKGGMVFPDRNDFAPSLGLAYRPTGSNRLILRTAYSIYYSPLGRDWFVNYLGRNYPFYYVQTALSPIDQASLDLNSPFETAATELSVRGIETSLRTGYVQYWQTGAQAEIFRHWNAEAWYQGSKATHMPRVIAGNTPLPDPEPVQPRRPNPDYGRFNILTGGGAWSRNSLDLALERRLSEGLSIKSGFDWQASMGDVFYGNPSNPRNLAAERAPSDYPPARQFYLNYIVDLPFGKSGRFGRDVGALGQGLISGWRMSGITRIQDGYRFSVLSSGDPNNDGIPDDRPDRLGNGSLDPSARSIDRWFNTLDFAAPAPYSYGNSGRNILVGPAFVNWDLSVIKQTRFSDGNLIELRVELFNAFNQVNFEIPNAVYGTSVFGKIFGAYRAREIELALRYSF